MKNYTKLLAFCGAFFAIWNIGGCKKESEKLPLQKRPIAITTLKVQSTRLRRKARLTGSVLPWKIENLKFQVPGKIAHLRIVTPGKKVRGELKGEFGNVLYTGKVIAELDTGPYELALQEARAQLEMATIQLEAAQKGRIVSDKAVEGAQARVDALRMEIEQLAPLDRELAKGAEQLAFELLKNIKKAFNDEGTTNNAKLEAEGHYTKAKIEHQKVRIAEGLKKKELTAYEAELAKAEMERKLQEAREKTAMAQVKSASALLKRALKNIERCTLRAPFDGVLSEIFVNPGAIVDPSVPIATLVMMDPVRVDMAVSFKKIRDFHYGNEVRVYPPRENSKAEKGYIYHLHTTADPSTRTFLAIIAVRNRQFDLDSDYFAGHKEFKDYKPIKDFSGAVHKYADGKGALYVDVRCIQRDEKGSFVWKVAKKPGFNFNPEATLRKVYVELGDDYINIITWLFRELKKSGEIKDEDILLIRPSLLRAENLKNPMSLALKLKNDTPLLAKYIYENCSPYTQKLLDKYKGEEVPSDTLQRALLDEINQILEGKLVYRKELFADLNLPEELRKLMEQVPRGENLVHLNRLLLEQAFQDEIVESHSEFFPGQKIIQLRQDWLFHPGELVEVEYDRELAEGIYLPSEAILKTRDDKDDKDYVFVIKDIKKSDDGYDVGMAERRLISREKKEDLWLIVNGIKPTEKVVIHGAYTVNNRYEAIKDDIPIRILKEEKNLSNLVKGYTIISSNESKK